MPVTRSVASLARDRRQRIGQKEPEICGHTEGPCVAEHAIACHLLREIEHPCRFITRRKIPSVPLPIPGGGRLE